MHFVSAPASAAEKVTIDLVEEISFVLGCGTLSMFDESACSGYAFISPGHDKNTLLMVPWLC